MGGGYYKEDKSLCHNGTYLGGGHDLGNPHAKGRSEDNVGDGKPPHPPNAQIHDARSYFGGGEDLLPYPVWGLALDLYLAQRWVVKEKKELPPSLAWQIPSSGERNTFAKLTTKRPMKLAWDTCGSSKRDDHHHCIAGSPIGPKGCDGTQSSSHCGNLFGIHIDKRERIFFLW